jgi:hypothetical protein
MSRTGAGSTFAVVFRARAGASGVCALRALLKTAKRRLDLRCLKAREEALAVILLRLTTEIARST